MRYRLDYKVIVANKSLITEKVSPDWRWFHSCETALVFKVTVVNFYNPVKSMVFKLSSWFRLGLQAFPLYSKNKYFNYNRKTIYRVNYFMVLAGITKYLSILTPGVNLERTVKILHTLYSSRLNINIYRQQRNKYIQNFPILC